LKKFIADNKLEEYIQFLGVLDRKEQLMLMKNALALIQPSLYEGWSTLVEEAKALNKYIILSNLLVHQEQISENCSFFEPYDFEELALQIRKCMNESIVVKAFDYQENIRQYGLDVLEALLD
jgi:glycosyltransferase involved in cell wall biosynthesis